MYSYPSVPVGDLFLNALKIVKCTDLLNKITKFTCNLYISYCLLEVIIKLLVLLSLLKII